MGRWLSLVILGLAATSLHGSPVTAVVSTVCTLNGASVNCPSNDGIARAGATTSFSVLGLGTDTGLIVNADASAEAGMLGQVQESASALAVITLDFFAATEGPVRSGLATFSLIADGDHGPNGGASSQSFVAGLGTCTYPVCSTHGTLVPFQLGVPFEVRIFASGSGGPGIHPLDGGDGFGSISLRLFELSGAPVTIVGPVPEPASMFLVGSVFAISLVYSLLKRKTNHRAS